MAERVIVFMDYQNVHGWARRQFFDWGPDPAQGHVDPLRVGQYLCERRSRQSELKQVRVYRGRPNPERQPGAAAANDRQRSEWIKSPLVHVTRRMLKYPGDWPDRPAEEKGIDVAIAIDMMRIAIQDQDADALILFSSDTDLLPVLETIVELKLKHVEVASWSKANRLRFEHAPMQPWCHNINDEQFRTLQDERDYALQPQVRIPEALRPAAFRKNGNG